MAVCLRGNGGSQNVMGTMIVTSTYCEALQMPSEGKIDPVQGFHGELSATYGAAPVPSEQSPCFIQPFHQDVTSPAEMAWRRVTPADVHLR